MPREIRKRGKKKSKTQKEEENSYDHAPAGAVPSFVELVAAQTGPNATPSWMLDAPSSSAAGPSTNPLAEIEAPFGYVDADVKAYFRTVDLKLRDWQDGTGEETLVEGVDANEERKAFITAALSEMEGKELQLATDPDCSTILERLAHSMDDFARRVLMDKLAGSYRALSKHRFASHVCQTNFSLARGSAAREVVNPNRPAQDDELRSTTQLLADAAEELMDDLSSLIMDPFGSHVIRALLSTLSPSSDSSDSTNTHDASARSKKSAAFKAKQGSMSSVLSSQPSSSTPSVTIQSPAVLIDSARRMVREVRSRLSDNEVRALASDKVASPALQIMLRIESEAGESASAGSMMDRVLMGLITQLEQNPNQEPTREDYIETLIRDPTSSHLVETLLSYSPQPIFSAIWSTYFSSRLTRLATHPVANFVVAKGAMRLDADGLRTVAGETGGKKSEEGAGGGGGTARRMVKVGRTGMLKALVERASVLGEAEREIEEMICAAFGFDVSTSSAEQSWARLAPCILTLQTLEDYEASIPSTQAPAEPTTSTPATSITDLPSDRRPSRGKQAAASTPKVEVKTQGAILLQALLRLHQPHNQRVLDSMLAQSKDDMLAMACDPSASRVIDVILEVPSDNLPPPSPSTIPSKARKSLIQHFVASPPTLLSLIDDRIGSRIADRLWAAGDTYLKEKLARVIMPHETQLAASFYGKFFARRLHLMMLRRKPEEWRRMQAGLGPVPGAGVATAASAPTPVTRPPVAEGSDEQQAARKEKKKRRREEDVIEDIFQSSSGKAKRPKPNGVELPPPEPASHLPAPVDDAPKKKKDKKSKKSGEGGDLADVLGAIKEIPKGVAMREGKSKMKKSKN